MTIIKAKIRKSDGVLVREFPDGREEVMKKHDWSRLNAMTDEERHAAAMSDPDARPWTDEQIARAKRTPQVRVIRRALRLSQEEFAAKFDIPLGTLRDWEQGRKEPDAAARAYLKVIARNPSAVTKALQPASR
jgi:putative transcriptional regulator